MTRDFQKNKAYAWESSFVWEGNNIMLADCQPLIDYVWQQEGLQYPPKVERKHKNFTTCAAAANRFHIIIDEGGITSNVLLHEIAHSMTAHFEGKSAMHGPRWLGVYIKLLAKYSRMDRIALERSALAAGLQFNDSGILVN